ncbi:MAG: type II toxin-antitoxin system RelE/ParE family toxin [Lachnospiraceae bacterium]|nr:type II toxin-antitoxin system RelE/ParE family toxin [Lachnospiraceae bacterium]
MYEIEFYEDKNGNSEIADFIKELNQKSNTNKESRINLNKIVTYLDLLEEFGTRIGEPVTKHLDGTIWELRPLKNRLLYAYYKDNKFIMLHHFVKKTRKIPKKDLEQSKRNLQDYLERNKSI